MRIKNNLINTITPDYIYLFLLSIFPLSLILGNFFINLFIFLFSLNFLINFKKNKFIFKEIIFYLLIFFLISLIINVFFSIDPKNSLPRVIKLFFVIFFIFEIKRLIQKYEGNLTKYVYKSWFMIFLIISIDILFEIIFGHNMIGNRSIMPGRIASFFGDELVVGAFYHGFILFFLSFLILKKTKNYILIFSILFVVLISFLIGERSNFIKLFLSVIIFTSYVLNINYKIKLTIFLAIPLILLVIANSSDSYKKRYHGEIKTLFTINGYEKYMKKSQHGAHRYTSMEILKDNPIFGVGIKNFRFESANTKYENREYVKTDLRQANHPHQIHHEFLSETGIFGYICFLIFILSSIYFGFKSYLKSQNLYQLSAIIFIFTSVLPIIPSGSFLSSFTSGIFWLNFGVMVSLIKIKLT